MQPELLLLVLRTGAATLLLAATGYALGRRLLRPLPLEGAAERLALRTVAGLVAGGVALTALALAGWLRPVPVALLAAAAHLAGWTAPRPPARVAAPAPGRRGRCAVLGASLLLLPLAALPLYPPIHHDAGTYHLPFVRSLATSHRLVLLPELRFPAFPQLGEILSVPGYWLAGEAGAQATHALFGGLTALLLLAWGRRLLPPQVRLWPAAAWIGNPLVVFLLGAAYVDLTLACFVTAGVLAWARWREGGADGWLALAGAALGAAVAVKYLGLVPLAVVVGATAVRAGRRLAPTLRLAVPAVATGGPMIAWIAATTGNPVFPFLPGLFGETPWSWTTHVRGPGADTSLGAGVAHALGTAAAGLVEHLSGALTLPFRPFLPGASLDAESVVSCGFLLALALGALAVRRHRHLLALELLVAGYALAWSSLAWPDARLALPVAPAAAVLACVGVDGLRERLRGRFRLLDSPPVLAAAALALAAPGIAYGLATVRANGVPPARPETRTAWLAARRGELAAVELLDRELGAAYRAYGLNAENARYFARGTLLGEWVGEHSYHRVLPLLADPAALWRELRAMGADHFLVVTRDRPFTAPFRPGFASLFRERLRRRDAVLYELLDEPPGRPGGTEGSPP